MAATTTARSEASAFTPGTTRSLPPGPRLPRTVQTMAMMLRQRPYLERQRRRYGELFTVRIAGMPAFVIVSDPVLVKQVFTAPATVLHAGDTSPLRPVLGRHSLLGIDEAEHLEQRKLLLPPFKGQRMRAYEAVVEEQTLAEIERMPVGAPYPVADMMQRITLRVILIAVFGATGRNLEELEELMPPWVEWASRLSSVPRWVHKDLGPLSPWGKMIRLRSKIDTILDRLIAIAKADDDLEARTDILALLVQARHSDGSPMTNAELRDQLITLLAAGHETTAHQLSWAVERLSRNPAPLRRLVDEIDAGGSDYMDATIREVQRVRPVIYFSGRGAMQDYQLGDYLLPRGTMMGLTAALTHSDSRLFADADRFMPERFLEAKPGTYEWIPFGGGIRRCIGATFAHMEMDVILRTLLSRMTIEPTSAPPERSKFRGVAVSPAGGGAAVFSRRIKRAPGTAPRAGDDAGHVIAGAAGATRNDGEAGACPSAANGSACPVSHHTQ